MRHSLTHTDDHSTDTRVLLTLRWYTTPLYRFRHRKRLAMALDRVKLRRECQVNDWAHELRRQGYYVPVGTVLCGERVTR